MCMQNHSWKKVLAGVKVSPGDLPELRLLISSNIGASQLLHQDSNDADEQDEIDLVEKQSKNSVSSNIWLRCHSWSTINPTEGTLEKPTMTDAMMGQLMSLSGTGFSFISQHLEANVIGLVVIRAAVLITATRGRQSLWWQVSSKDQRITAAGTGSEFSPRVLQVYPTYDPRNHEDKRDSWDTKREESV